MAANNGENPSANSGAVNETEEPKKKRHRGAWTAVIVGGILVVLAAALTLVPRYAARYVMEQELAKLGIETTGVETVVVDLWRGEVMMGPVEFWSEGSDRGQIGNVGAKLSLATLFKKRALIETFLIEKVDLIVERSKEGIMVNGVSLEQFLTAEEKTGKEVEKEVEDEKKSGWGAGIDKFEFRNSKLKFKDLITGDELNIDLERLFITLFHTWDPDSPGVVSLRGKLDGAPLTIDATARPFAEDIQFRVEAGIVGLKFATAMDYGRLALILDRETFTSRDGTGSTKLSYSGFLGEDGGIEMNGEQTVTIDDLHLVTPEDASLKVKSASIKLRSAESYTPDGRIEAAGEWTSLVEGLEVAIRDGASVRLQKVSTDSDNFFLELNADKSISASFPHSSRVEGLEARPDAETALSLAIASFAIEKLNFDQNPAGDMQVEGAIDAKFEQLDAKSGPDTEVSAASVSAEISDLSVEKGSSGPTRVSVAPKIVIMSPQVKGATPVTVEEITVALTSVVAEMAGENISVQTSGSTTVDGVKLTAPGADGQAGTDASIASVRVDLQNLNADIAGSNIKLNGGIGSELSALTASVGQPGGAMTVSADQLQTSFPTFDAQVSGGTTSVNLAGNAALAGLETSIAGADGQPGTDASIGSVRVDLQSLNADIAGSNIKVNGGIGSELSVLTASVGQPGGAMTVSADQLQTSFPTFDAQVSGGSTSVNLAGNATLAGLTTSMPAVAGRPEMAVGLATLEVVLNEVVASIAGAEPQWRVAVDVDGKQIDTELKSGDSGSTINVASVVVSGVQTDQNLGIAIDEIVVGGLDADLVDKDLKAFGGGGQEGAPAASSTETSAAASGAGPTVRLGRLAVGEGSSVKFTDTSVDPPVVVAIGLNEVDVKNIDTGDPAKRTDLKLKATINESSKLGVEGWATPLKPTPDFKLSVNLQDLPLPTYSSYVSTAIGWHLDGGELSTNVAASANNNALKGNVGVTVDNLFLNPVTAADGEKLEKQIGVPLQFAVGILKDENGRINLKLPVSGTLDSPEVDYSSVIRKAVSGFLGSIFGSDSFQGAEGFKLSSIAFMPGSAEMDAAGKQVAEKYLTMLEKKSTLKIGVCGRATVEDYAAMFAGGATKGPAAAAKVTQASAKKGQQAAPPAAAPRPAPPKSLTTTQAKALVELAMERTTTVKNYLIEEKGIDTKRIVQCRVTYDLKDDQSPRVQFAM